MVYDLVPNTNFDWPKLGFAMPLNKWMKKDLKYLIEESLSKNNEIIDPSYLRSIVDKFGNGKNDYLYNRLWELIMLNNLA